jgi:isoleucyl-tRNA synthetase
VALDTRITEELAREGMARDIIRQVQELRKKAGLEMEDRITLHLSTSAEPLLKTLEAHRDYIGNETLVLNWAKESLSGSHKAQVKIEGHDLTLELKKA